MPKLTPRQSKLSDLIRRELALIIRDRMSDPRIGRVTVSEVGIAKDLSSAKVYISALDEKTRANSVIALNHAAGFLRTCLAEVLKLRVTPALHFLEDTSIEHGDHIIKLIKEQTPKLND